MNVHDIMRDTRVAHVRTLKAENTQLRERLARLQAEHEALESHLALALLAARDSAALPDDGKILLLDGWNILLGARTTKNGATPRPRTREALAHHARDYARAHADTFVWLVFDGENAAAHTPCPRMRISYTGGTGAQRADRLILDFLNMMRLSGARATALLVTGDHALRQAAEKLNTKVLTPDEFDNLR